MDALNRSLRSSREVASAGVVVDAKDPSAASFYKKYGFMELPKVDRRFFCQWEPLSNCFRKVVRDGQLTNRVGRGKRNCPHVRKIKTCQRRLGCLGT